MPDGLKDLIQALSYGSAYSLFYTTRLFIVFYTVLFALQWAVSGRPKWRTAVLTAFSLFFYWKAGGWFVLLIVATATYDFFLGQAIHQQKAGKRWYYYLSLALNLGLLAWFKYQYFFAGTWGWLTTGTYTPEPLQWALPIGISYYTFKTLTYIIGLWQEEVEEPERDYLSYLLYVTFFANLLAGPITRAEKFLAELRTRYTLTPEVIGTAFWLFLTGLFKKLVVADYLAANFVGRVFEYPESYTGLEILLAAYGYGIQLYMDFSGYTDMALGVALLLGFNLGQNFREPFKAQNVTDFWRRWHITLSTWFNDYVFLPMNFGWRRHGRWATAAAVTLTFVLSGLWHGPRWTFVLWGTSHGLAIAWDTVTQNHRRTLAKQLPTWLYAGLSVALTYSFLAFTYLFFVAKSLPQVWLMFGKIFSDFNGHLLGTWLAGYSAVAWMLLAGFVLHFVPTSWKHQLKARFVQSHWALQVLYLVAGVYLIYQFQAAELQPFIYLQF